MEHDVTELVTKSLRMFIACDDFREQAGTASPASKVCRPSPTARLRCARRWRYWRSWSAGGSPARCTARRWTWGDA